PVAPAGQSPQRHRPAAAAGGDCSMNVTAIGYPNVVGLADSQRNFGNMILSDLNHHGVANAHEDTSPSVPACSFLGSAALERKGFLATTSTGAPAVRQHGGGRAHRALLTQQPSGRPTRLTGGEIKSLCCAAAGIIALAFRPCGAHSYPLTGVRQAAHPAAPLRSSPRPHAQPVKGYGLLHIPNSCIVVINQINPGIHEGNVFSCFFLGVDKFYAEKRRSRFQASRSELTVCRYLSQTKNDM